MGIRSSIRNFFYAATHANQLITENVRLNTEKQALSGKLWKAEDTQREIAETLEAVRRQRDNLSTAVKILVPKDISLHTLQELYNAANYSSYEYEKAGEYLLGDCWHARKYFHEDPIWDRIETEVYRAALTASNILPQSYTDQSAVDYLRSRAINAIDAKFNFEDLGKNIPIGKIEYLQPSESIEYRDAGNFISDIMHCNHYGVPMAITVYSDPTTGNHIDTSWRLDLDPPPQGFQIEPYECDSQADLQQNAPAPMNEFEME